MTPSSTDTANSLSETILEKLQDLPETQQQQILDYIEFLAQKYPKPQPRSKKPRVAGLHRGKVWISDDFNDPLPPEYWSGQD
ncbi:type II toxin-antitoxin system VapB family antitoxin [Sodalinema gerasimenkoae]|uniref:type II toxin-antitoxin system VapB family antitoxin n=1 Tax=Sodalinema gerasimenkoae TaxID=2862348 RepID=UPI00135B3A1C|nr:DUF2281 domain-containing protein [Sodalinema gerasimenkoae]